MATVFFEGKKLPTELRRMNGYGDNAVADDLTGVAKVVEAASPWDLLTGLFVTKPAEAAQAQVEAEQVQAEALAQQQATQAAMVKWLVIGGVAIAAVFGIVLATKPSKQTATGRYRRQRRSHR